MGFHSGPLHSFKVPLEKVQPGTARAVGELRHDGPWKLENTGRLQKRRLGGGTVPGFQNDMQFWIFWGAGER